MPRLDEIRDDLIAALDHHYGSIPTSRIPPFGPDPGSNLFRRLARVALSLVATPTVASAAFDALDEAGLLQTTALASANPLEIDDALKQARVAMAIKSLRPLQNLARWAVAQGEELTKAGIAAISTAAIREDWRGLNGIGLASADALLLGGLQRASYPVDRATFRIMVRHGWLDTTADYDEARSLVERFVQTRSPTSGREREDLDEAAAVRLLEDLSVWLARVGRDFCKPTVARCERCPLQPWVPPNGPVEGE